MTWPPCLHFSACFPCTGRRHGDEPSWSLHTPVKAEPHDRNWVPSTMQLPYRYWHFNLVYDKKSKSTLTHYCLGCLGTLLCSLSIKRVVWYSETWDWKKIALSLILTLLHDFGKIPKSFQTSVFSFLDNVKKVSLLNCSVVGKYAVNDSGLLWVSFKWYNIVIVLGT